MVRKPWQWVPSVLACAVAASLALGGCSDRASGSPERRERAVATAVPVVAAEVADKVVPIELAAVGTVQAYATVGVKSQVAGQIVRVHFAEGQDVRTGQVLFTIDPRPFEAALRQAEANLARDTAQLRQAESALLQRQAEVRWAEANLARDTAQLENARAQERRYRELVAKEFVAREQYDQMHTNAAALEATVSADRASIENAKASALAAQATVENARAAIRASEAAVESARLPVGYATIRAPMDGRTGNLLVQAGNVVKANEDNPLVVIAQIHPIYVSFGVPEQSLADVKRYRASGSLAVEAQLGGRRVARGQLTFMNNTVDASTGTIQLKATFQNSDNVLWPGQFVDVVLTLASRRALVVPSEAIQAGQQGTFVFVVKPDLTVELRPIDVGLRLGAETVVERGLRGGERVVVDGQLRLVPGVRVELKPRKAS